MWSSTGNFPPTSLLDGQYTDLGSYHGCLDAKIPQQESISFNYTSYCVLAFRPIVPTRPKSHAIFYKLPEKLRSIFSESNVFRDLIDSGQYFHYIYLKTGVCVPSSCSSEDVQKLASTIARRLALMSGPVKCLTRAPQNAGQKAPEEIEFGKIEDEPVLVELSKPLNDKQYVALILIGSFFGLVFLATFWHLVILTLNYYWYDEADISGSTRRTSIELTFTDQPSDLDQSKEDNRKQLSKKVFIGSSNQGERPIELGSFINFNDQLLTDSIKNVAFKYFSAITNFREFMDTSSAKKRPNEIGCLHGLRVCTMVWIICVHTLQYNQWDGFTRIFENVAILQNITLHPIYNASYVVDNFFFMSGLLAAYTVFSSRSAKSSGAQNFSITHALLSRYLRLTPQVLLISLMYILLPLASEGPFWYDMTHYSAKYCEKNWWVNLLHLQAFYREDEICNLVGWWISVDMFFYVLALGLIYLILNNQRSRALLLTLALCLTFMCIASYRHFKNGYTPSNLGTVPQVAEVWTGYVVNLFWSPYAHVVPFYLGLWCGFILAKNKFKTFVEQNSKLGWFLSIACMSLVNLSTHVWMSGYAEPNNQYISTSYNTICATLWAFSFAWLVIACHYQRSSTLNRVLSLDIFIILSKASFIIYLSHMLLVRYYFGVQNALLEVSRINVTYIIIGNVFISVLFGSFLCVAFEGPCLKFQRLIIEKLKKFDCKQKISTLGTSLPATAEASEKGDMINGPTGRV